MRSPSAANEAKLTHLALWVAYITSRLALFPGPTKATSRPSFLQRCGSLVMKDTKPIWWEALHGIEAVCAL